MMTLLDRLHGRDGQTILFFLLLLAATFLI